MGNDGELLRLKKSQVKTKQKKHKQNQTIQRMRLMNTQHTHLPINIGVYD